MSRTWRRNLHSWARACAAAARPAATERTLLLREGIDAGEVDADGPQAGSEFGVGQDAANGFGPGLASKPEHPGTPHLATAHERVQDCPDSCPGGSFLALQQEARWQAT